MLSAENAHFVLGSHGRPEIRRLQLVKDRLNRRSGAYVFLMADVRSEWRNTHLKFRLLADYADAIVGVARHSRGGFLVEQGYFTAREEYFERTHVFARDYETLEPDAIDTGVGTGNPHSGMHASIFEMLDDADRLCRWATEDDLVECAKRLP